ncbi:hypothetical protein [Micromonospora halophytica]|uniref:PH domain-containing protein n=1 Tax=Micromonospora halophytica TaxID=47864 RepID=A0A1C5H7T5_9ACTN|nr:hypothetical protein [Micromonospora halophytica]SCG42082.1 hypothetical protein GA0070560_103244 [Micromonospora halophytica]
MTTPPPWPPSGQPSQHPYGPPPQHPYGAPPPGYPPPPPPAPVTKRIPEDQPFVVRPNVAKRGLVMGGVVAVLLVPILCILGVGLLGGTDEQARGSAVAGLLALVGCLLVAIALPIGLQLWLIGSGGPVLALGPAGLWIRTRPTRGQAVWLPWEAVAQISRRRWSLEKMLVVKPYDQRALQNLGTFTALDSGLLSAFYGSGLVATLNFADRPESEILAAVAHYSAGRCRLL